MKAIVVYYSLEGNSEFVAEIIAKQLGADTLRLKPVKDNPKGNFSKYFFGGMNVIFKKTPKLTPYQFNKDAYDTIIIGTPVWADGFAPAILTFLKENDLSGKIIALYACSASGMAKGCLDKLETELSNANISATLSLKNPKIAQTVEDAAKIKEFCEKL